MDDRRTTPAGPDAAGVGGEPADLAGLIALATETAFHEPVRALALVERARALPVAPADAAALTYAEGLARFYAGDPSTAITHAIVAGTAFDEIGDQAARSQALSLLADACNRTGRLRQAAEAAVLALESAQEAADLSALAWAICALGNTTLLRGEPGRAVDLYAASRDAFAAAGDRVGESWMTGNLGEALVRHGETERGLEALDRCLELVLREAPATVATLHVMRSDALRAAGRPHAALASARDGVHGARARGSRDDEALALAAEGLALVRLGRTAEASGPLGEALGLAERHEIVQARLNALIGLGDMHAVEGRDEAAVERLAEAERVARAAHHAEEARAASVALSDALARLGRWEDAFRALRRTVDVVEPAEAPEHRRLDEAVEAYLSRFGTRPGIALICASCKSVHDTLADHWRPIEGFISRALEVRLSHGLCPSCFATEMQALGR